MERAVAFFVRLAASAHAGIVEIQSKAFLYSVLSSPYMAIRGVHVEGATDPRRSTLAVRLRHRIKLKAAAYLRLCGYPYG